MMRLLYFIDPNATPIKNIDFKKLRNQGITDVAVPVWTINPQRLKSEVKPLTDAAGLALYGWCWDGYDQNNGYQNYKYMADNGIKILLDEETYSMPSKESYLSQIRNVTKGKVEFIVCVKADGWDGSQSYPMVAKYADFLMPMLYLGDYRKSVSQLADFMKNWNSKLPNKICPCLETYESDRNVVAKSHTALMNEINAVKPYSVGVGLFRLGLSKFEGIAHDPVGPSKTLNEVLTTSKFLAESIQKNQAVPANIKSGDVLIEAKRFARMMSQAIINIHNGNKNSITIPTKQIKTPPNPAGRLSKGELQKKDYIDAINRLIAYIDKYDAFPNYVTTPTGNLGPFNVLDMWSRALAFYRDKGILPSFIYVKPGSTPEWKGNSWLEFEQATGTKFNSFTEIYNWILRNTDYGSYLDDKLTWKQELDRKLNYLNCVDMCQALSKIARSGGYQTTHYGIYCPSYKVSHAIFKIKGKEFTNETWIDGAAAASDNYQIGSHWCDGALTKEPGWIPYE